MTTYYEDVVVKKAVEPQAAKTKKRIVFRVSDENRRTCEDMALAAAFIRCSAFGVPVLLVAGVAYLLYATGVFSALAEWWRTYEFMACLGDSLDPPECRYAEPDMGPVIVVFGGLLTCGFFVFVVAIGGVLNNVADTLGKSHHAFLKKMGWDGTSDYRFEVESEPPKKD